MTDVLISYSALRAALAENLGRQSIPKVTLARWMSSLKCSRESDGKRGGWTVSDLVALTHYGIALKNGLRGTEAINYVLNNTED